MLATTGCMDVTQTVLVKKDGSGTITQEMYMNAAMAGMMAGAMAMGGEEGGAAAGVTTIDIEKLKADAAKMGEGVKFVSANEVTKADGSSGVKAIFAFDDIRKLKISEQPDSPGGPGAKKPADGPDITFDFKSKPVPQLVINIPQPEIDPALVGKKKPAPKEPTPEEMMQLTMMKSMFQGMRMRVLVQVDGRITQTNAKYTSKSKPDGKTDVVTIMDMDIGKLMENEANMGLLAGLGGEPDMQAAKEAFSKVPGVKLDPSKKIAIVFR
jgi:hypothetical protein